MPTGHVAQKSRDPLTARRQATTEPDSFTSGQRHRTRAPLRSRPVPLATRTETIQMPDGGEMGAYVALPEAGHGPGLLVLMEIFGVGSYIRRAAERLAELGYVALAPDLYRRTDPGLELEHDPDGLERRLRPWASSTSPARSRTRSSRSITCAACPRSTPRWACWASASAARSPSRWRPRATRQSPVSYYGSTVADCAR